MVVTVLALFLCINTFVLKAHTPGRERYENAITGDKAAGIIDNAVEMKIVGVIRPAADAENASIRSAVAYTSFLTDYPITYAAALNAVSMAITMIGGLAPARKAAKMDPVTALRTE